MSRQSIDERSNGVPSGEYLTVDPDDVLGSPEKLEVVLDALEWTDLDSADELDQRAASLDDLVKGT